MSSFMHIMLFIGSQSCTSIIWFHLWQTVQEIFFFLFSVRNYVIKKMVAVSEGCWFDSSISVCTVDHFFTVSFYPTIAGDKFCLHSLTSRDHFLNLEFTLDAVLCYSVGPLWFLHFSYAPSHSALPSSHMNFGFSCFIYIASLRLPSNTCT